MSEAAEEMDGRGMYDELERRYREMAEEAKLGRGGESKEEERMSEFRVQVSCDRCGLVVDRLRLPEGTSGFYDRGGIDSHWGKYMLSDENILCDGCMQSSEGYQRDYGGQDDPPSD